MKEQEPKLKIQSEIEASEASIKQYDTDILKLQHAFENNLRMLKGQQKVLRYKIKTLKERMNNHE